MCTVTPAIPTCPQGALQRRPRQRGSHDFARSPTGVPHSPATPLGPPQVPRYRATVGSYGGVVYYERGTPVCVCSLRSGFTHSGPRDWRPIHLPTTLSTYVPSHLPIHLPTYLPTYLSTYLTTFLPTYLPAYLSTYLPIYLRTYPPTYVPTYLRTYVPPKVSGPHPQREALSGRESRFARSLLLVEFACRFPALRYPCSMRAVWQRELIFVYQSMLGDIRLGPQHMIGDIRLGPYTRCYTTRTIHSVIHDWDLNI